VLGSNLTEDALQGARHYQGLEEAMLRNISACQQLAKMTKTALGPHGKCFPLF
jgi:T-complex protein 1 subunit theta